MDAIPRDLQLAIVKRFDMDTRIKTGVVSRLNVPSQLSLRLDKVNTFKVCVSVLNDHHRLCEPYNNYLTEIGRHDANVWLDEWYAKDWPKTAEYFLAGGNPKFRVFERLRT
jgi:hypothetical protein